MKSKIVLAAAFVLASAGSAYADSRSVPANEFKALDTNANGYLSEDEAKSHKEMSARMDDLDMDKDGQLSEEEFGGFESQSGTGMSASDRSPEAPGGASEGESAQ